MLCCCWGWNAVLLLGVLLQRRCNAAAPPAAAVRSCTVHLRWQTRC